MSNFSIKSSVKKVKESNKHGVRMKLDPNKNYNQATLKSLKKWFPDDIVEDGKSPSKKEETEEKEEKKEPSKKEETEEKEEKKEPSKK